MSGQPCRVITAYRVMAFEILNNASPVSERRLFAVVDGAASLLEHGGDEEAARLLLQAVVGSTSRVAAAALDALTGRNGA